MQKLLPTFRSVFLERLSRQFDKRHKALSYFAKLQFQTQQPDEFEWLTVNFEPNSGHYVIFQFVEDNRISLYVRSRRRADRGKVLYKQEDFNVVDNCVSIIDAVEATVRAANDLGGRFEESVNRERIRDVWKSVAVGMNQEAG